MGIVVFRDALKIAYGFTAPVVLSRRALSGQCSSTIGAFVFLNDEGWILTAGHILEKGEELTAAHTKARIFETNLAAIQNDGTLSAKERRSRLGALGKRDKDDTVNWSAWWSRNEPRLVDAQRIHGVDLGVARLEPFDPAWVSAYPTIKDPDKDFDTGAMLCKLGFPFHSIVPIFDEATDGFVLPVEALPIPFFPIEGIFTRVAEILLVDASGNLSRLYT